jgi:hypothetical protein
MVGLFQVYQIYSFQFLIFQIYVRVSDFCPRFAGREVSEVGIWGFAGLGGIVPGLSLAFSEGAGFGRGAEGLRGFSGIFWRASKELLVEGPEGAWGGAFLAGFLRRPMTWV